MPIYTFADLKATDLADRINLCPTDPRFREAVNRVIRMLLLHGNWWGTYRLVRLPFATRCLVTPGAVASLEAVYNCDIGLAIGSEWAPTHPGWNPNGNCGCRVGFEQYGTVPSAKSICSAGVIRSYASNSADYGKTITYLGYDANGAWVQTEYNGALQDGETVVLADPFVDTVTTFSSLAAVRKEVTAARVLTYVVPTGQAAAVDLSTYEYWETNPSYMRYRVRGCRCRCNSTCESCGCATLDCMVKLEFIPIRTDNDIVMIGNIPALELALEAMKLKDDGRYAEADALLFGSRVNTRLGAIPLLQQELRTYTSDRTSFKCHVQGTAPLRRAVAGMI